MIIHPFRKILFCHKLSTAHMKRRKAFAVQQRICVRQRNLQKLRQLFCGYHLVTFEIEERFLLNLMIISFYKYQPPFICWFTSFGKQGLLM